MRSKINDFWKALFSFISATLILGIVVVAGPANSATMYPAGSLLQPGDVTSSHIRNNEIVNADINASAAIVPTKLWGENTGGNIFFTNYSTFGTSTALTWATSTSKLSITGSLSATASTTFNSVEYLFPSADGSANQALKTNGAGGLSWGTVTASQVVGSFTAGNTIAAGKAVYIATTTATIVTEFDPSITNDIEVGIGDIAGRTKEAQHFTEAQSYIIERVSLYLSKVGAPADDFQVAVQADSAGQPSGVNLATATKNGTTITGSSTLYTLTLSSPVTTTASTKYWLVFSRSGGIDGSNYVRVGNDNTSPTYTNGGRFTWNGSSWADQGQPDYGFMFYASTTVGRLYATNAATAPETLTFVGITSGSGTRGSSIDVVVGGIANNLSGLTAGSVYYLSNTLGAISSTAGTVSKKVGAALSATTLLIQNTW